MIGKLLNDRYKIKKQRGSGGMALVYEAQDILLDRKVAIKMLRPEFVSDEDFINKFRHEAKAVARITHPNVVSIYDIVESEESLYLVMEYIEGKDLKSLIKKRGQLSVVEALDIANQVTAGVEVAHENNIVHCDIKPHNILITDNNQVKVTDFGIARAVSSSTMTITDTIMGSAHYFSPEQAQGKEINTYSDIYSIGVVLYEMLSGRVPFKGESPISVALKHIQKEPKELKEVFPSVPEEVNELVMKTLSKEPEDRQESASQLREEIIMAIKNIEASDQFKEEKTGEEGSQTKILNKSDIKKEGLEKEKEQDKKVNSKTSKTDKSFFTPEKKKGFKLNKWVIWALVVVILASASVFGLVYFFKVYTEVPIVKVPNLVEKEFSEAEDIAAQQGLNLEKSEEAVFHNDIEEGYIVTQEPKPGERIKQTRNVVVTVSKGPKIVELPDFNNRPLREAEVILDNLGLSLQEVSYEYSEQYRENYIISQSPEPGSETEINTQVELVVSKGPQPIMVTMPSLLGVDKERAFNLIQRNGLKVGKLNYGESTRYEEGLIMNQQYEAGENVPENSTVDLGISTGLVNKGDFQEHKTNIGINIVGSNNQEIKIVVKDSNGEEVAYQKTHSPGEYVNETIYSVGPTVLEIYRDGELIKSKEIGA
ncbi:MAG TPA: Stk1 family PASTA domain-containing Ser/Thr kinase [Halanaerobiales bacterium]|nr:Stk1 family PASTA domain-containing Ser/Thr kinase [Halanaerobiales bacterium]